MSHAVFQTTREPLMRTAGPIEVTVLGAGVAYRVPDANSIRRANDQWHMDVEHHSSGESPDRPTATETGATVTHFRLDDVDFTVNVYAAVVTSTHDVDRASPCSVLEPDRILPFLAGLTAASR